MRGSRPCASRSSASLSASAPRCPTLTRSDSPVSSGPMAILRCRRMSPVSRPSSICMSVTPVSRYRRATAHCAGAAPLSSGKSEAWTFRDPCRSTPSASGGRIRPYAATTATSGLAEANTAASLPCLTLSGCSTRTPCCWAHRFVAGACNSWWRPTGLSGCATTSTSSPARAHASTMGSANSGVPMKAKQAAPQIALLLKDPLLKEDAALALEDLGGPEQVDALLAAVDTTVGAGSDTAARAANRTNFRIAEALGNIGDARAGPALLRLARSSDDNVRIAAVEALGNVKAKDAIFELSHILGDPPAPPPLLKRALVAPRGIGDPSALPALAHGLVIERQGVSFLPESSFALVLLGEAAVEPLMKIAQDQDPAYLAWAKENNRAPAGTYAKAALVLGDLEDPRAAPVLVAKLKYVDPLPVPGTAGLMSNLVRMVAANALGRMRATQAAPAVQAVVSTANAQDEEVTTFAAEALVWIGDRAQARELMRKAQTGLLKLRLTVAQSAALFGEPVLGKDVLTLAMREAKGSQQACARQLSDLTMPVADPRQACDLLATQFGELSQPLDAARVCASDASCWLPKLQDPDPAVRARAGYELGRAGAAEAIAALAKAAGEEELLARTAATRALDWLASVPAARPALKGVAPQLASPLAQEQGKGHYWNADEDLRLRHRKLSRLRYTVGCLVEPY